MNTRRPKLGDIVEDIDTKQRGVIRTISRTRADNWTVRTYTVEMDTGEYVRMVAEDFILI